MKIGSHYLSGHYDLLFLVVLLNLTHFKCCSSFDFREEYIKGILLKFPKLF